MRTSAECRSMANSKIKIYDSEGFQLVVRGSRPRLVASSILEESIGPPIEDIVVTIQRTKDTSSMGQFAALVSELLQCISCEDIVCYGIGRFGTCCIARQQLALLLHIASAKEAKSVLVYDPLLSSQEKAALEKLGCINIHHNELCQRQVQGCTLFYMPHCGQAMYNNLLWANWSPQHLMKLTLIGNSFQSYVERAPHREMKEKAPFIFKVMDYCQEYPLPRYVEPTVFNDLCLHTFPLDRLLSAPPGMWTSVPPPSHPSDPEIIL